MIGAVTAGRRPRGRPPAGGGNTRDEILAAARRVFAANGFDRATLRTIAAGAGVDAAMVRHYFGDKAGLFRAALYLPVDPSEALARVISGGLEGLGERVVRFFLSVWEPPGGISPFVAFLRGAAGHDESRTMLHELLDQSLFPLLAKALAEANGTPPDEARLRVVLCGSQLVGMGMARYVISVEPVATLPVERLAQLYGPTLQRYLAGPLAGPP